MELQQLRYFVCVAKYQNISKAAMELNLSQSALSRAISSLEESIGITCFERSHNNITLNEYGKTLLVRAKEIIELEEKTQQELYDQMNTDDVPVRLIVRCIENIFPFIIRDFKTKFPNIKLSILQNDDFAIIDNRFDLMISGNIRHLTNYNSTKLLKERLLCAIPKNHPLAKQDSLSPLDFAKLPMIQFGGNRYIQHTIKEYLRSIGLNLAPNIICDDVHTACKFVVFGYGVLIIPEFAVDINLQDRIALLPIEGHGFERDIYLHWRKNCYHSENTKQLRSFIINCIKNR